VTAEERTRGQPLLVFAVILGAWLVGRVLLWVPPFAMPLPVSAIAQSAGGAADALADRGSKASHGLSSLREAGADASFGFPSQFAGALAPPRLTPSSLVQTDVRSMAAMPRRAAGHQMLLAAAFAHGPALGNLAGSRTHVQQPAFAFASPAAADRPLLGSPREPLGGVAGRLSGDAWLYWRDGSAVAVAPGVSSYGRSQAGAVMRYRLLPQHSLQSAAYVRVTRTLEGSRQEELAAGVSLRPLAQVPVTIAAEARVTDSAAGREVRPAAFAVTQLPPAALPLGMRGEAYLQAGYVGGRFKTAFVDGQARVDRRLARLGLDEEIRVGVGTWGGAQRGAARIDVGPTVSIGFKFGYASARIAADYRLRVAGDAAPASGPAVTFSAGF